MIKKWFVQQCKNQWLDKSATVPSQRWSQKDQAFFLDSVAGLIKYKPKNLKDQVRFRDKYINQFDMISLCPDTQLQPKMFFLLYNEIRQNEKVKYRANLRTRLRGRLWSFADFI